MQVGDVYSHLTILEIQKEGKLLVRCSCGVEKVVNRRSVKSGAVRSCGHLRSEAARENIRRASEIQRRQRETAK